MNKNPMTSTVKLSALVFLLVTGAACVNHQEGEITDCNTNRPDLVINTQTNPTNCDSNDGRIVVTGTGGEEPYQFSLNNGAFQASGTFEGLGGGAFALTIKDANGCESQTETTLTIPSSDLSASYQAAQDTECTTDNGSITVNATGSNAPFMFSLGTAEFSSTPVFTGLKNGNYVITVKDADNCVFTLNASVARGETGVSWTNDIKPIIDANCAISGCHISGGGLPNFTVFANVQSRANGIKTRTGNRSMPIGRSLTQTQIDLIACWVDDGAKQN